MTRALIVVDVQNDFCEGGSLGVAGGSEVALRIGELLHRWSQADAADHRYSHVVATRDHHVDPGDHWSRHRLHIDDDGVPQPRTHGWTRDTARSLWELLDYYAESGLRHLLCTDIGRDGAMTGPNVALYREIAKRYPALHVQASGGVSGLADLSELAASGARYAITGKALLEGCFTVAGAREHLA